MRELVRKLGHIKVIILISLIAIISSEIFVYLFAKILSAPYPYPSTLIITFLTTAIITPIVSWHLLDLLFYIDKLEQKMHYLATYNTMTNVLTRQAFFEQTQIQHENLQKKHKTYTLCIIDIDNFKLINDSYGHAGGDKVLIHFGKILNKVFMKDSIVGRIGGEEFAVFIDEDIIKAQKIMEKLEKNISLSTIIFENKPITFTISIGMYENDMTQLLSLDETLSFADKALYHAKATGKNKIVVFSKDLLNNNSHNLRTRR